MKLIIGSKFSSSWSLRSWLLLKYYNIPFDEILIPLNRPETQSEILKYSSSGKVPCLIDEDLLVWDSLSIAEYLNEKYPEKQMWPSALVTRAIARSISAEMHSGFPDLRRLMPYDLNKNLTSFNWSECSKDIERVKSIWRDCLMRSNGPFLFGNFTIADAMYAPVVDRFISYGIPLDSLLLKTYMETMRNLPAHKEWRDSILY
jgi:glutathione S-transferase